MNHQSPFHKILVLDETSFFKHNSGNSVKQFPSEFFEGQIIADAKRLIYTLFVSHLNLSKYFVVGGEKIPESYDVREYQKECKLLIVNQNKKYAGFYVNSKQLLPSYPKNYF